MAGLGHLFIGFLTKIFYPKMHIAILLLGTEVIDIIFGIFWSLVWEYVADENREICHYWSHGLFMSIIWSILSGVVMKMIFKKNYKYCVVFGGVVFSHWIIDFITHPMGALDKGAVGLPLLFENSRKVGLGLYNISERICYIFDLGSFVFGLLVYITCKLNISKSLKKKE